jgi:hypothetical protein
VQVGDQDAVALHKAVQSLLFAPRDQGGVGVVEQAQNLLRDIADMHGAVVVEQLSSLSVSSTTLEPASSPATMGEEAGIIGFGVACASIDLLTD